MTTCSLSYGKAWEKRNRSYMQNKTSFSARVKFSAGCSETHHLIESTCHYDLESHLVLSPLLEACVCIWLLEHGGQNGTGKTRCSIPPGPYEIDILLILLILIVGTCNAMELSRKGSFSCILWPHAAFHRPQPGLLWKFCTIDTVLRSLKPQTRAVILMRASNSKILFGMTRFYNSQHPTLLLPATAQSGPNCNSYFGNWSSQMG
mmetsp:Transcript_31845/g.95732  ORF Transcript_31845/g.95732 Transcript_31845/m.95732 type:complete len:205 (-) Transcript_31845:216-830(-)